MAAALVMMLITAIVLVAHGPQTVRRTAAVAYFANSNGLFPGDEVRVLGVPVGKIDTIEPQPQRVKVSIWFDSTVQVPADVKAVILSPSLVTSRAIALMPAYTGGAEMKDNAVIPQERTAVPVEFDDFRQQLDKLTQALQPTQPGGVSPLGSFVNTAADNLRGHADPADDPCVLAVSFFCRFVPIAPDLHGDADLTKQLPQSIQPSPRPNRCHQQTSAQAAASSKTDRMKSAAVEGITRGRPRPARLATRCPPGAATVMQSGRHARRIDHP